jgi:hypothetical protein
VGTGVPAVLMVFPFLWLKITKMGKFQIFQIWKILQISKIANYEVTNLTAKV